MKEQCAGDRVHATPALRNVEAAHFRFIKRAAIRMLQSGESPKAIIEALGAGLSRKQMNTLSVLLTNVSIPYEQSFLGRRTQPHEMTAGEMASGRRSYLAGFMADDLLPGIKDPAWRERIGRFLSGDSNVRALHLAIFVEPYLQYILDGRKTIESRFNSRRCAPYQKVQADDILLLKRSSGPVVGLCQVASAWFYHLDRESWGTIRREYAQALCAQDPTFWQDRQHASYATLMRIHRVCPIAPARFAKRDRRGWVLLATNDAERCDELAAR